VKVCFSFAVSQIGIENGARWIAIGMVFFGRMLRIAAGRKRPRVCKNASSKLKFARLCEI
jgi:hypothetical protein